jgi:hypothetical protein
MGRLARYRIARQREIVGWVHCFFYALAAASLVAFVFELFFGRR